MSKARLLLFAAVMVAGMASWALQLETAQAAGCAGTFAFGRQQMCGYFDNRYENTGLRLWNGGMPANISGADNNAAALANFINFIKGLRGSSSAQNVTAAEFIIDTMEGRRPPSNSRGLAWTLEPDWENRMRQGIAEGVLRIQWNTNINWSCGQVNTFYQPAANDVAPYLTTTGTSETPACGPGVVTAAIVFSNPRTGQRYYVIKRNCGNPIGNLGGLPSIDYTVAPSGYLATTTVTAGTTDTLYVQLKESGPSYSEPGNLQVDRPAVINQPCGPTCVGPGETRLTSGATVYDSSYGYRSGSAIGGVGGPDWFWATKPLPTGSTTNAHFNFTVSAAAAPGNVTFQVCFNPANQNGATTCVNVILKIVSLRTPAVQGLNGDVQAGGGLCGGAQTNGFIQGYTGAGSYGQYVLSAGSGTNTISNFNSNGTGANILNLGQSGGYNTVCRENLLSVANAYRAGGGAGFSTRPGGTNYDISGWSGIYYIDGNAGIYGTVNNKLTIVVNAPTLTIVSPGLTLTTAKAAAGSVPSLGIIASSNIDIASTVTRADAYMFADGTIDTCTGGSCSTPQLVINGFLMAHNILFDRLGPFNSNGKQVTEKVVLNPQIYLNPPQFFDSSVDQTVIEGLGEKPPLY